MSNKILSSIFGKQVNYAFVLLCVATVWYVTYLSWLSWIASFVIYWALYCLAFFIAYRIYELASRKKKKTPLQRFVYLFSYIYFWMVAVFFALIWIFIIHENYLESASLPEFTISNSKKTVIFQTMSHIWSDGFYKEVSSEILKAKKQWFAYFYEWVRPWTKENQKKFDKILWFEISKDTYSELAKLYGLRAQKSTDFINIYNNKDYNADVSIDDIINIYESKYSKISYTWSSNQEEFDIISLTKSALESLTPNELYLFREFNKAILNYFIKNWDVEQMGILDPNKKNVFDVILNDRNKVLADAIMNSSENKIYVTYWLLHFEWVWSLLQQRDHEWKLEGIRYLKPIR